MEKDAGLAEQGCPWRTVLSGWPAAIVLVILYWLMAVTAVAHKSATFDEPAHVAIGYSHIVSVDYRLDPAMGPLVQRWAALPLWLGGWAFPDLETPPCVGQGAYQVGGHFLYEMGYDADRLLWCSRAMTALLAALLGLLIYFRNEANKWVTGLWEDVFTRANQNKNEFIK